MKPNITLNIKSLVQNMVVVSSDKPENIEKQMTEIFTRVLNQSLEACADHPNQGQEIHG